MTHIVLLSTGGTIASRYSAEQGSVVSSVAGDELVSLLGPLAPDIPVKTEEFSNVGSYRIDLPMAFGLARRINALLADPEVAGVVVTHGTDTMEESAYLADLVLETDKPVVFTGAQMDADQPDSDGPRNLADAIRVGAHASLDIASIPAFAAGLLPLAIARLPDVEATPINLRALGGEEVAAQVRGRLSDLGFCSLPVRGAGLQVHWAIEVDCVAVLREEDPLAAHAVLPLKALDGRRLITTANPYRQRRHVDEALQGAGLSRRTPLDTNTSLSAMASVRAGLGIALIEPLSITGAPMHGLVQRPLDVALPFRYGVITRGGFELPAHLRELISHVAAVIREAIPSCVQMPAARDDVMGASGAARATRAGRAAEAKDGTRS